MKRSLTSLPTWEMQIKATKRYHHASVRMAKIKRLAITSLGKYMVQLELSYPVCENINCNSTSKIGLEISTKAKDLPAL